MKKIATIKKELKNYENVKTIENYSVFSETDKLNILIYLELKKALNNKTTECVLDCDYTHSKTKDKELSYNYIHIVSSVENVKQIQLKYTGTTAHFNLSTQFASLIEGSNLNYKLKIDKKTRAVKSIKVLCGIDDIVNTYKTIVNLQAQLLAQQKTV